MLFRSAYLFVGVMTYSQYTYVEAFINQKQKALILAHIHMYEYFGGVAKILVLMTEHPVKKQTA